MIVTHLIDRASVRPYSPPLIAGRAETILEVTYIDFVGDPGTTAAVVKFARYWGPPGGLMLQYAGSPENAPPLPPAYAKAGSFTNGDIRMLELQPVQRAYDIGGEPEFSFSYHPLPVTCPLCNNPSELEEWRQEESNDDAWLDSYTFFQCPECHKDVEITEQHEQLPREDLARLAEENRRKA